MSAIVLLTFVAFLASAGLGTEPPTQDVKGELREAGKHVGNAARTAVDRTKEGVGTAAEKVRTTGTKAGHKVERAGDSAKKKTKKVVKDLKE